MRHGSPTWTTILPRACPLTRVAGPAGRLVQGQDGLGVDPQPETGAGVSAEEPAGTGDVGRRLTNGEIRSGRRAPRSSTQPRASTAPTSTVAIVASCAKASGQSSEMLGQGRRRLRTARPAPGPSTWS